MTKEETRYIIEQMKMGSWKIRLIVNNKNSNSALKEFIIQQEPGVQIRTIYTASAQTHNAHSVGAKAHLSQPGRDGGSFTETLELNMERLSRNALSRLWEALQAEYVC